jgi:hypothetical protein
VQSLAQLAATSEDHGMIPTQAMCLSFSSYLRGFINVSEHEPILQKKLLMPGFE